LVVFSLFAFRGKPEEGSSIKNFFYSVSQPLQAKLWKSGGRLSNFFGKLSENEAIMKENEELRKKNQELLSEIVYLRDLKEENEMLRKALDIGLQEEFKVILVELTCKDVSTDSILIDKGSKSGIAVGMPLITEEKVLVGKVTEVHNDFSRVVLISSVENSFPAEIQEVEATAILKGKGKLNLSLEEIPQDKEIKEGDVVITTSLGENFPKDLLIGEIRNIIKSDMEPYQKAEVSPFFDIEKTEKLFAITSF